MGLRIPTPSPRDLEESTPIPGQAPSVEPIPAPTQFPVEPEPEPVEREPAQTGEQLTDEEILQVIQDNPDMSDEEMSLLLAGVEEEQISTPSIESVKASFLERFQAGLPISEDKRAKVLKKLIGKKGKVKIGRFVDGKFKEDRVNGEIHFKRPGETKFQPLDPDDFGFNVETFGGDVADLGGDLFEGVISGLAEAGIIVGGTGSTFGLGAPAATGIALATGPAIGMGARDILSRVVTEEGILEGERVATEVLVNTGVNAVFFGAGKIGQRVIDAARGFFATAPKPVAEAVVHIQSYVDDIIHEVGPTKDPFDAGAKAFGRIEELQRQFGEEVELLKDTVTGLRQQELFSPSTYMGQVTEILKDQRAQFSVDKNGLFRINVGTKAIGAGEQGKIALKGIVDQFNEVLTRVKNDGGLHFDEIDDMTKSLQARVGDEVSDKNVRRRINNILTTISSAIKSDRDQIMVDAIDSTVTRKPLKTLHNFINLPTPKSVVETTMGQYADNIGAIKSIQKVWNQSDEAGDLFMDAMTRPGNQESLKAFKNLLGDSSVDWLSFKSSWMDKTLKDSIDPLTKVFNPITFQKKINSSRIAREIILSDEEFKKVGNAAIAYSKLDLGQIPFSQGGKKAVQDFVEFAIFPYLTTKLRGATNIIMGSKKVADYLNTEGFMELAKKSATNTEVSLWLGRKNLFQELVSQSKPVKEKGILKYAITPGVRHILRRLDLNEVQENSVKPPSPGLEGL